MKYLWLIALFPLLWFYPFKEVHSESQYLYVDPLGYSDDSISISLETYKVSSDKYLIKDTINLHGKTWYLPSRIELEIKEGLIKNGSIVGNNTRLNYKGVVFNRVHIKGIWLVENINTSMFSDLTYDNSLKDVFALINPKIKNRLVVEPGSYRVTAIGRSDHCIVIGSNCDVTINGDILLTPNEFSNYSIIFVKGSNICIKGTGTIIGDKDQHLGNKGEWGIGVEIAGGDAIKLCGLTIKDCWGDCVYITGKANNVLIEDCVLDNGRRQGVSIISADSVFVKNCLITNVNGTAPECAIDVEPNKGDSVKFVLISGVKINNCRGGIASYRNAERTFINTVIIENCSIYNTLKYPLGFTKTCNVVVKGCNINHFMTEHPFYCKELDHIYLKKNIINGKKMRNTKRGRKLIHSENVNHIELTY